MNKKINIKIEPNWFKPIVAGKKNFLLIKDDKDIQIGDLIILEEWDICYTGKNTRRTVTYVLRDALKRGLRTGYCIVGF